MRKLTRLYFSWSRPTPNLFPFVALYGAFLAVMMVILVNSVLTNLLGLPPWMGYILLSILILPIGFVLIMAAALVNEKMWKIFGIYRLFNVTNYPIEEFFMSIAGIETDA